MASAERLCSYTTLLCLTELLNRTWCLSSESDEEQVQFLRGPFTEEDSSVHSEVLERVQ